MKLVSVTVIYIVLSGLLFGQALTTNVPKDDHSASTATLPFTVGTIANLPATCTIGSTYFATDATAGSNLYFCTSTNVWTQMVGTSGNTVTCASSGGVTCVNGGSNVQLSADGAIVLFKASAVSGTAPTICVDSTSSGTTTTYALSCGSALPSYATNQTLTCIFKNTNTVSPTANFDTLGAKPIVNGDSSAITASAIKPGLPYTCSYDGTSIRLAEAGGAVAGVSSFTGDGIVITNSGSTGAVTATLANAPAHKYLGNNTGSSAAPAYDALVPGDLPNTAVTPGSYTNTNLTVDQQGRITAASNGSGGGGGTPINTVWCPVGAGCDIDSTAVGYTIASNTPIYIEALVPWPGLVINIATFFPDTASSHLAVAFYDSTRTLIPSTTADMTTSVAIGSATFGSSVTLTAGAKVYIAITADASTVVLAPPQSARGGYWQAMVNNTQSGSSCHLFTGSNASSYSGSTTFPSTPGTITCLTGSGAGYLPQVVFH